MSAAVAAGSTTAEGHWIVELFDAMGGDPPHAIEAAQNYSSTGTWVASQASQVATHGRFKIAQVDRDPRSPLSRGDNDRS